LRISLAVGEKANLFVVSPQAAILLSNGLPGGKDCA
jgi:hypothetical protein